MRLSKIVESIKGAEIVCRGEDWEREITALSADSRTVEKNDLFFCLSGGSADGHRYAQAAVKAGAAALVVERVLETEVPQILVKDTREAMSRIASAFYGDPSSRLSVIGVTGTNGKTTTSYMLASILEKDGKKTGVIGTLGVRYDGNFYPSELTTPDPIFLQKTLAEMSEKGVRYVVMEVSAHALYYKKTAGIRFAACIFTNLTQDHLDFFPSMREYKYAKSLLFMPEVCPIAVLNGDEETGREFGDKRGEEGRTLYYGLQDADDGFAIVSDENLLGSTCVFNVGGKICRCTISMTGRHNVSNALAAATCAVALGADIRSVAAGLAAVNGVRGRLERVANYNGAEIFVDFAHTPDGLEKSLAALRAHCRGRLVCLFGCGGNRDKSKRPIMGETVAKSADFAILTSDNPRYEDPLDIISGIERGYRRFSLKYVVVPDRRSAIGYATDILCEGDVLLVAGKGGEEYQEIMGIKYPFDDNDIIEKIIRERRGTTLS